MIDSCVKDDATPENGEAIDQKVYLICDSPLFRKESCYKI